MNTLSHNLRDMSIAILLWRIFLTDSILGHLYKHNMPKKTTKRMAQYIIIIPENMYLNIIGYILFCSIFLRTQ